MTDQDAENITRTEELAYELKVEQVMTRDLKAVTPGQTIRRKPSKRFAKDASQELLWFWKASSSVWSAWKI